MQSGEGRHGIWRWTGQGSNPGCGSRQLRGVGLRFSIPEPHAACLRAGFPASLGVRCSRAQNACGRGLASGGGSGTRVRTSWRYSPVLGGFHQAPCGFHSRKKPSLLLLLLVLFPAQLFACERPSSAFPPPWAGPRMNRAGRFLGLCPSCLLEQRLAQTGRFLGI